MAMWTPRLSGRSGPKYRQIVDAIADDIARGALPPGSRLPPQRILAYTLGLSPNTTSRAYAEAVGRGLLFGEVGRGTFVRAAPDVPTDIGGADMHRPSSGPIDFSRNLPAPGTASQHLQETLAAIARTPGLQTFLDYQMSSDLTHHADAAISFLERTGVHCSRDNVIVTSGAQHGLLICLMATLRPGDLLLTEAVTYAPIRAMADHLGLRLGSVAMDENGISPDALNEVCEGRDAKALYLMPNLQTPTTITIDPERRSAIAELARRHDLILIEDDVFGLLKVKPADPICRLAPERTIYVTSTSKCLSPGLRVGFVHAPMELIGACRRAVNISCWMPPPLMMEIVARWVFDGTADRLTAAQRAEAAARQALAISILAEGDLRTDPEGFHLWLNLPAHWSPEAFRAEAARRSVALTDGSAFAAEAAFRPRSVRLALSHESSRERVKAGLTVLRDLLREPGTRRSIVI